MQYRTATASDIQPGQHIVINDDSALVASIRETMVGYRVELNDGRTVTLSTDATVTVAD